MNKRNLKQLEEVPSTSKKCDVKITPICAIIKTLTLWTIEAFIISKSSLKQWTKGPASGEVINFDVKDDTGQIRIVAFNQFTTQLDSNFVIGDCIQLSQGLIKKKRQSMDS